MIHLLTLLLGVFLLAGGLLLMRYGLNRLLWYRLQTMLSVATETPWRGLVTGTLAAALFQSSTAVCLLTIGLVTAEYLTFRQGLGVILGANIGTCSTVGLLSVLSMKEMLPLLLVFAGITLLFTKSRNIGLAAAGLFGMFCGLDLLNSSMSQLQALHSIQHLIHLSDSSPWHGILAGVFITFLFQSSSAATAMLMTLTENELISLTTSAYIVYGNNLGSCLSSLIVSTVAPLAAKQVAVAHILLNVFGVMLFLPITGQLVSITCYFSSDIAIQVATIHTLFNVLSSLAALSVIGPFSQLVQLLTPSKRV